MIRTDTGKDSDRDGRSDVQELLLKTNPAVAESHPSRLLLADPNTDTDRDGLTDYEEDLLGTNLNDWDTDGDWITDTLEVQGFTYGTRTWYTDPLDMDSNGDGIDDGREWNLPGSAHATWDWENDGTPDLLDRDDDDDGVADNLDMSPHVILTTTFTKDQPFSLIIDRLTPGKLTYVEFQVNPVITQHLWYAHNVLDWPKDDRQGQIQDDDGETFYDLDNSLDPWPSNNGDLKLLPMLEIMISGSPDNLPPTSTLQSAYGIHVQPFPGTDKKAVYVPLQLVTDNRGGARVAFTARWFTGV
jgi:hypothetical protein